MKRTTLWVSSLTLLAASLAGCVSDFTGTVSGKGSAVFCVQDDPTVNFNGVFVNFGNIQINQNTSGNNTINDNDTTGDDETMATSASDTGATMETTAAGNDTTATSTATTTQATTDTATATETMSTTETVAQDGPSSVQTISVDDIDCGRVEAEGAFDGVFRGQAGGDAGAGDDKAESCAPENPGCIADDRRGASDSPCDRDQGFGNDAKCESVDVEAGDVDVLQFKDREAAFLAQADLDPGTIEDVCLTVEDVRVVTSDGQEVNVDIEGGDLCLDGPIVIEEGKHTLVVFKVDVDNSFAGSTQDRIVFSPVIKVQAAAPVTTTITVEETVTQTSVATGNQTTSTTDTMMTTDTANATTTATASPTETAAPTTTAANGTATTTAYSSPAPTTTGP